MKVKTNSKFNLPKGAKIGIAVGAVAIAGIAVFTLLGNRDTDNFYTKLNEFVSVEECNFRYVINVRSDDYEGNDMSAEELEDALNKTSFENDSSVEGNKGFDYVPDEDDNKYADDDQTGKLYSDRIQTEWTTADGSLAVDSRYPNYEMTIVGRVESTEPLAATLSMKIATDYVDADFLNATFIDGKCYFDVMTLKRWLSSAGDSSLVALSKQIPEGTVYVVTDEAGLSFQTEYAEELEVEQSGATGFANLYDRLVVLEKMLNSAIKDGTSSKGLSADETRYRLALTGEDSASLVSTIKSLINNSGSHYSKYASSLGKAGLATEEQVTQMMNEKDNFLTSMQPAWLWVNTLSNEDVETLNLKVVGKARDYASGEVQFKEINLGTSFVVEDIEYIVSVYGCKASLNEDNGMTVAVPEESVVPVDTTGVQFSAITDYLTYYFKLSGEAPYYSLESNWEALEDGVLRDFCNVVNASNKAEGYTNIQQVTMYNVLSYINSYAKMTEIESNVNPAVKFNYDMVQEFLKRVRFSADEVTKVEITEEYHAESVVGETEKGVWVTVDAVVPDNPQLLVATAIFQCELDEYGNAIAVLDATASENDESVEVADKITIDLNKFYVLDNKGNKYPCNFHTALQGLGTGFSLEDAPTSIDVPADGDTMTPSSEVSVRLNFVTSAFGEYELYYDGTSLGKIIVKNHYAKQ